MTSVPVVSVNRGSTVMTLSEQLKQYQMTTYMCAFFLPQWIIYIDGLQQFEGWAQNYGNSNIFLKPLFRGNLDPFVNNANLGAIAHTSNGT